MIRPSELVDAVVAALASIPELADAMHNKIEAYRYTPGVGNTLLKTIDSMPYPSMLVLWNKSGRGTFNGYIIWQHEVHIYWRVPNAAKADSPVSYDDVWYHMMNGPINEGEHNIRMVPLLPKLDLMETPSAEHTVDSNEADVFFARCVFNEIGDDPTD